MKKTQKISLFLALCFAAILCFSITALIPQNNALAKTISFESAEILNYYNLNDQKTFPESVTVNYDGEQTASDGIIIYPNGYAYALDGQQITLTQQGGYTLKYFFDYQGRRITAEKTFKVSPALYGLSSNNGSSITAVSPTMSQKIMTSTDDDALVLGVDESSNQGLIVRLNEGCTFNYNKPIDLTNCKEDGLTDVLTFIPRTSDMSRTSETGNFTLGTRVAGNTYVRLTDCYNPDVYVELVLDANSGGANLICYRAGTNSQEAAGIYLPSTTATTTTQKEVYYDGVRGIARFADWGPYGLSYRITEGVSDGVTVRYDLENSKIYVACAKNQLFVNDFMNPDIYGSVSFDGFTTGEVYLSIRCDSYFVAQPARMDILSIGSDDGAFLADTCEGLVEQAPEYYDDVKPVIKINVDKTDAYGMYCAIGDNFIVPTATVYDANDSGKLSVNVYRNYLSQDKSSVGVADGKFKVDTDDVYYIEYKSTDLYGNEGVSVLKVYADSSASKSLSISVDQIGALNAGEKVSLALPQIITVNNKDKLSLSVSVIPEGKDAQSIVDVKGKDAIDKLAAEDLSFVPLYSGNYKIVYACKDNVNEITYEYQVVSQASDAIVFLQKPFINRYLIKDAVYGFEEIKASTFVTGEPIDKDAVAFVSFDGQPYVQITDLNKVKIDAQKSVQIKFVCEGVEIESEVASVVNAASVESIPFNGYNIKLNSYFQFDQGAFEIDEYNENAIPKAEIIYNSLKNSGNNTLRFINPLSYRSFVLGFKIRANSADFAKLNIILSDPYDISKKVVIAYEALGTAAYVSVDGGMKSVLTGTFAGDDLRTVFYDNSSKKINFAGVTFDVDIPFTSNACYLDVELVDISGNAGIEIVSVDNQSMDGTVTEDMSAPEIYVKKSQGDFKIGDIITIYHAEYLDVLSPIDKTTAKVKVTCEGKVVNSIDGVPLDGNNNDPFLDYKIEAKALGSYKVEFSIKDTAGRTCSDTYIFNVVDSTAPVIKLSNVKEGETAKMKAGTKFKFGVSISDDISTTISYRVIVTNNTTLVNNTYSEPEFFIIEKGSFTVRVVCKDDAGNVAMVEFDVIAE